MPRDGLLRSVPIVAVVAALSNGPSVSAQGQSAAARTVLVTVEFRALQNGAPLFDLRPQDIGLRVDNVDRDLVALDLVRSGADGSVMPAPFATNGAGRRGRDLLFVVDEESYQPGGESRVQDAVGAALGRLTAVDRAGVVSLHPSGVSVALTASPVSLQAALRQIRGRAIGSDSTAALACRTRRLIPVMTSLFQGLDTGVTTTIVLLSAALAAPQAATIVTPGIDRACQLTPEDFDEFRGAAGGDHRDTGHRSRMSADSRGLRRVPKCRRPVGCPLVLHPRWRRHGDPRSSNGRGPRTAGGRGRRAVSETRRRSGVRDAAHGRRCRRVLRRVVHDRTSTRKERR